MKTKDFPLGRRKFLKLGAVSAAGAVTLSQNARATTVTLEPERLLSFYNTHTGEQFAAAYWHEGEYVPEALTAINRVLRDHRSDEIYPIDTGLLDLLCHLRGNIGGGEFHVISGFRSSQTNASLASRSEGVAKHSLHMRGMAIDVRVPGVDLAALRRAALQLRGGGVGYYARSDFVHIDVGRVRWW